ncbi:hypothetical protein [Methylobacterium sp. 1030]|uniref:hypothetical protein n=1 Tax=Methylobacterium sp. 1030 TaxID=3156404 RepID=UPI00339601BF
MVIKDAEQALDEAERVVDSMVKDLHASLWASLSPAAAEGLATNLLQQLRSLKREGTRARDTPAALDALQRWHRTADIVQWWSQLAPDPFRSAGFRASRDLRPLIVARGIHEGLAGLR